MTGQPGYTFRGTDRSPSCPSCASDMTLEAQDSGTFNERDVYRCAECGDERVDRWTF